MRARPSWPSRARCSAAPPKKAEKKARPSRSKNRLARSKNRLAASLAPAEARADKIAIHPRNHFERNLFRTRRLAFANVAAAPEALCVKLANHLQRSLIPFRLALRQQPQMRDLRAGEQRRRRIRTGCHAGSASNARRRIHG